MVGLCGSAGVSPVTLGNLASDIAYNGDERIESTQTDDVVLASVSHPRHETRLAETADGDVTVSLWGTVWGDETDEGYQTVDGESAAYCAERYVEDGTSFPSGLNGNFVGVVHDSARGRLLLFTDRLATRPVYSYRTDSGLVFSTSIQSLPLHPAVETGFDVDYLTEYFALRRTYGCKTPLEGVETVHPGTVLTLDLDDGSTTSERYWEPVYDPVDADASTYARRLATTMREVVADRTDDGTDYGLLMSGGSDSRLVLAALKAADTLNTVETFHLNERRNREARIAERAADAVDVPHRLLQRDADYQARAAATAPTLSNFVGYFNQHHAGGFADTFREHCDVLLTGHYGDMLFKADHLRSPTVDLGPLGRFDLPFEQSVDTLDAFVTDRVDDVPDYLDVDDDIEDIYAANVTQRGQTVVDHGVTYRSFREATLCNRYPLTNSASQFFYHATAQMLPTATPFLDNRLIDLFLSIPVRHLLRGNLVNRATAILSPTLGEIPHGRELFPIRYPFALNWASELALDLTARLRPDPDDSDWQRGPWTGHDELIRRHSFVRETIHENEATIRALPFLDWEGVNDCYEAHLRGADRTRDLYTLVTFLNMPVVERL